MRLILFMLFSMLLLSGCGSDETPAPVEQMPNYFPDAVGSRWIYRNSDGHQWTREVSGEANIEGKDYRIFKDTTPLTGTELDFLNSTYYRVTPDAVMFTISEKVTDYLQTELPKAVQDEFAGLELTVAIEPFAHPELVFFQIPLVLNFQWDAFNVEVSGNIVLQNLLLLQIPFEVHIRVKGEVVAESPLATSAGNFEKTYQIEYQTEITHTLFSADETIQGKQTLWFVPHVGVVKIEDEHDVTELIEYSFFY
ncbi:hypothetical protein C6500_19620 [Candidatus Poribacteria bacterium]|nr:MAG: hypothetical protein C6500_19620 [Candidatus Poribacteria bacterium]